MIHLLAEGFTRPTGGIRRASFELRSGLRRAGVHVHVAGWVDRTSPSVEERAPRRRTRAALQLQESASVIARRIRHRPAISHGLYYDLALSLAPGPTVVTAYDMIHERFGEGGHALPRAKRLAVLRADIVVCISHATATDVRAFFPAARDVRVIHLGVSDTILRAETPDSSKRRHLLYVGRRSGYKNFDLLLSAIEHSQELRSMPLVLAGGGPLTPSEQTRLARVLSDPRVDHRPHVDEATLIELYDTAAALTVPSQVEGFGLPVLEAMSRECPVACSNTASLTEISDGHAFTFDPADEAACADAILRAVRSGDEHRRAAAEHAQQFTWERAVRQHVDLYTELQTRSGRQPRSGGRE